MSGQSAFILNFAAQATGAASAAPTEKPYTIHEQGVWLPQGGSTFAEAYDSAWDGYIAISIVFFAVVIGPGAYFAWKYKRKSETEKTSPVDHNTTIEIVWTLIPTLVLFYMFWVGFKTYADMQVAPNEAMEIRMTGQMYNWTFEYPNGVVTTDLYVPKDRPVKLLMSSKDVIHSFWVPEFRVKQDVVPGLYTTMWFQATKETETVVECAEYCGDGHSKMLTRVHVFESKKFDEFYANDFDDPSNPVPPAVRGQRRYEALCASCHSLDGSRIQGPSFQGIWGRSQKMSDGTTITADANYIKASIVNPQGQIVEGYPPSMPSFSYLKDKDIDGIIAFLKEQK
jgi:cytochrome c oxidase subunit 2